MIKILILAYVVGTSPMDSLTDFTYAQGFRNMEECKEVLLKPHEKLTTAYKVIVDFIVVRDYKYDWIFAKCYDTTTGQEYVIEPIYDNGIPKSIQQVRDTLITRA